ncbi:MAG TPA: ABC transporter substrate-binding protein [Sphingomonadaceae bacterium]|nr:ABC transporter substrate-binding protein [Sphingomonadaceae bacterium]
MKIIIASLALGLSAAATVSLTPAVAVAAVDNRDPGRFIDTLADTAFASLRTGNPATARGQFRAILAQHFDVVAIGDRLIQRQRPTLTPAQLNQYRAAFPGFIVGTYGDRLAPYANADLKVIRVVPRGDSAAVVTTVTRPGARPANAVWTVTRTGSGYKVNNLTVGGVNLGLAQQADFDSFIKRRGFDALIAFMRSRG